MANRYADWFRQAEADLRHARNALKDGDFEWSCFAAQQAAEKAIKAVFQLCLILSDSDKPMRERIPEYLPVGFPVGLDLFPYTRAEFERLRSESPGWYAAIRTGRDLVKGD